jgi:hypothetical protein
VDKIDLNAYEEAHKRYTQHLAQAMRNTKEILVGQIFAGSFRDVDKPYEIEVDFNE